MPLITCRNATFAYEGIAAVRDVSFEVTRGDFLCIVGENGSGKSTLMKGLLGLHAPQSGTIEFGGGLRPTGIGYLPQQSAAQKDFPANVREVVLSGRLSSRGLRPFYTSFDRSEAERHMEELGIARLANRSYRELSGGQQQRVLLARALCATESLLLLDEPVAGLDPVATADLYRLIETIRKEQGVTIIMVSHDIRAAVQYGSHILHMHTTQLFYGTTAEYTSSPIGARFLTDTVHAPGNAPIKENVSEKKGGVENACGIG
ncbi:MAG: metal ABC transporter ATP-binding protein [Oscillospiraceae bacterium]|jgi:zinc transport system ATP-binding protein|nr:metal ABC transporter ATP-binding protein [Oscillospiraceae bacterium]